MLDDVQLGVGEAGGERIGGESAVEHVQAADHHQSWCDDAREVLDRVGCFKDRRIVVAEVPAGAIRDHLPQLHRHIGDVHLAGEQRKIENRCLGCIPALISSELQGRLEREFLDPMPSFDRQRWSEDQAVDDAWVCERGVDGDGASERLTDDAGPLDAKRSQHGSGIVAVPVWAGVGDRGSAVAAQIEPHDRVPLRERLDLGFPHPQVKEHTTMDQHHRRAVTVDLAVQTTAVDVDPATMPHHCSFASSASLALQGRQANVAGTTCPTAIHAGRMVPAGDASARGGPECSAGRRGCG